MSRISIVLVMAVVMGISLFLVTVVIYSMLTINGGLKFDLNLNNNDSDNLESINQKQVKLDSKDELKPNNGFDILEDLDFDNDCVIDKNDLLKLWILSNFNVDFDLDIDLEGDPKYIIIKTVNGILCKKIIVDVEDFFYVNFDYNNFDLNKDGELEDYELDLILAMALSDGGFRYVVIDLGKSFIYRDRVIDIKDFLLSP